MTRGKFTLWHSFAGMGLLLVVEGFLVLVFAASSWSLWILMFAAGVGAIGNIYVSTEVVQEVRNAWHMLTLLSVIVAEFVAFFAFEYGYLLWLQPASFPSLTSSPVPLILNSVMTFVFNPLFMPGTVWGQTLLVINSLGALGLVLFILQNIGQFRHANA